VGAPPAAAGRRGWSDGARAPPPARPQVWDIAAGAAAGTAAVLISMPFDVIKTYAQMNSAELATQSIGQQVSPAAAGGRPIPVPRVQLTPLLPCS
jgi:hypothetical protein